MDSGKDARRPQLRGASVAPRVAALRGGSALGGADRGADPGAAGIPRGVSRSEPALLSPGKRGRERERRKSGGRVAVQRLSQAKALSRRNAPENWGRFCFW